MKTTAVQQSTTPAKGEAQPLKASATARNAFVGAAVNMTWQLALVVLVPIIVGVRVDKALGSSLVFTFIGLGIAVVGSVLVMRNIVRAANKLPVAKLSAAQKRAIQKQYEEDDD